MVNRSRYHSAADRALLENERQAWRQRAVAFLASGPKLSGELIKAMGARSFDDGARISHWLSKQPDFVKTHKVTGLTGHENWVWEHRPT